MATLATLDQAVFLYLNADLSTAARKLDIAAVAAQFPIYLIPHMLVGLWCWGSDSQYRSLLARPIALGWIHR